MPFNNNVKFVAFMQPAAGLGPARRARAYPFTAPTVRPEMKYFWKNG